MKHCLCLSIENKEESLKLATGKRRFADNNYLGYYYITYYLYSAIEWLLLVMAPVSNGALLNMRYYYYYCYYDLFTNKM